MVMKRLFVLSFTAISNVWAQISVTSAPDRVVNISDTLSLDGILGNTTTALAPSSNKTICQEALLQQPTNYKCFTSYTGGDLPILTNWTLKTSVPVTPQIRPQPQIWYFQPSQPNSNTRAQWSAIMTDEFGGRFYISQNITIPMSTIGSTFGVYFYTTLLNGGGPYVASLNLVQLNVSLTGQSSGSSASSVVNVTDTTWTQQRIYFQIGNGENDEEQLFCALKFTFSFFLESSVNLTINSITSSGVYGPILTDIQMYQVGSGSTPFPTWAIVVCIVIPAIIIISVISVVIMKRGNHCAPDTDPELEVMKMKSNQTSAGKNNKTGGGSLAPTRLMTDADVQAHNERILVQ